MAALLSAPLRILGAKRSVFLKYPLKVHIAIDPNLPVLARPEAALLALLTF